MTEVKICGLSEPETLHAAVRAGADYIGFMFVDASPRAVTIRKADLLLAETGLAQGVAVVSDAGDDLIDAIRFTGFPVIQLHGAETPERAAEIKAGTGMQVWKVIGVHTQADLHAAEAYRAADGLLIETKPPEGTDRTGGHGAVFDWSIMQGWQAPKPWMLAGGLHPGNVADAIAATGAPAVDVSSGVESARGVKDAGLIEAFIRAAKEST